MCLYGLIRKHVMSKYQEGENAPCRPGYTTNTLARILWPIRTLKEPHKTIQIPRSPDRLDKIHQIQDKIIRPDRWPE